MREKWLWMSMTAALGCDTLPFTGYAPECPLGELSDADLPCACAGTIVESVDCGAVSCGPSGVIASTSGCSSSDTGS